MLFGLRRRRYPRRRCGDLYGYVRDASGNAIQGVVVSDGYTCTATDADGLYALQRHPSAYYVYYSTPADCKVEINATTGLPQFYQKLSKSQKQYDFTLTRQAKRPNSACWPSAIRR